MVGLVIVAHSQDLARGVCDLATQMTGGRVPIVSAAGLSDEEALGTDATRIVDSVRALAAREACESILILVDLGSAVLSAETALELLGDGLPVTIRISRAALVEGAVAAAVAAAAGRSLDEVDSEACAAGAAKLGLAAAPVGLQPASTWPAAELVIEAELAHPHGLHARPAAAFVARAAEHAVQVRVRDRTRASEWVDGTSLTQLVLLGSRCGDRLEIAITGPQAELAAIGLRAVVADVGTVPGAVGQTPPIVQPAEAGAYRGTPASPGLAAGAVRHLERVRPPVQRRSGASPQLELGRAQAARQAAQADLEGLLRRAQVAGQSTQAELLAAHRALLDDPAILQDVERRISGQQASAEGAWEAAIAAVVRGFETQEDEYVRARSADVRDVGDRVLWHLAGAEQPLDSICQPGILVAEDLSASQIIGLDPRMVWGICTAAGTPTSHASILARALLIPAVVGLGSQVLTLPEGTQVLLDGDGGWLKVQTPSDGPSESGSRMAAAAHTRRAHLDEAQRPAITRDGRRIEVAANIGSLAEARTLSVYGAESVGVLRTEFLYLGRQQPPDEDEQAHVYGEIVRACAGKLVIARTLDVGGDKHLPFIAPIREANPFLGLRGLRLSLHLPELFGCQLRALLRAGVEPGLRVMFPMVTTVGELEQALELLGEARSDLRRRGVPHAEELPVGMMVEVPSAALMAEAFARQAAFMSLGTNDLAQYTQAAERTNPRMVTLGDAASPAVLRLIAQVVQACRAAGIWAGICGELAADPALTAVLVGLGVDELSMSPAAIPRVKAQIRRLVWEEAQHLAAQALNAESAAQVRALVTGSAEGSP